MEINIISSVDISYLIINFDQYEIKHFKRLSKLSLRIS